MGRRHRSRGNFALHTTALWQQSRYFSCADLAWQNQYNHGVGVYVGEIESMSDEIIPRFHERRRKGEVFFNQMSSQRETRKSYGGAGWHVQDFTLGCSSPARYREFMIPGDVYPLYASTFDQGNVSPSPSRLVLPRRMVSDSDISSLMTEVSTSVLSKRGRGNANVLESIAQADQALALLPGSARTLRSLANSTLQKKYSSAASALAGLYLAYRYGVVPLVNDVAAVSKALNITPEKLRETSRATGRVFNSGVLTRTHGIGGAIQCISNAACGDTVLARAMSLDEFSASALSELGVTTKNFFTLPWELVPWSFVLDWVVNVGDLLGSIAPSPGYKQLGSCLVLERHTVTSYVPVQTVASSGYSVLSPMTGGFESSVRTKSRGALSTPGLTIKSDFRFSNLTRALDAIALATQAITSLTSVARRAGR